MSEQTIYIVDDDEAVRDALALLISSVGYRVQTFDNAKTFLSHSLKPYSGCIVLDIRMPEMSGLDLQRALCEKNMPLPIIFITGHGDVPMAVQAMKAGAIDFLQKPFRDQELLDRIQQAIAHNQSQFDAHLQLSDIQARLAKLTQREQEVMALVAMGNANKVIAADLNISQRTVELHRAKVMEKMKVRSLADLVKLWIKLQENEK